MAVEPAVYVTLVLPAQRILHAQRKAHGLLQQVTVVAQVVLAAPAVNVAGKVDHPSAKVGLPCQDHGATAVHPFQIHEAGLRRVDQEGGDEGRQRLRPVGGDLVELLAKEQDVRIRKPAQDRVVRLLDTQVGVQGVLLTTLASAPLLTQRGGHVAAAVPNSSSSGKQLRASLHSSSIPVTPV